MMQGSVRGISLLLVSVLFSSAGQTVLKLGLNRFSTEDKASVLAFLRASITTWQVVLGIGLFGMSVLLWMRVLADAQISWAYPMLGLSYVFVALAGMLVFGEQLGPMRLVGIVLVIAGAIFIGRS